MRKFITRNPWQAGLATATILSLISLFALRPDQPGHSEWWCFLLLFAASCCLIAAFWTNDNFVVDSGLLLAEAMDQNVEILEDRLGRIELQLQELRELLAESAAEFAPLPLTQDQPS